MPQKNRKITDTDKLPTKQDIVIYRLGKNAGEKIGYKAGRKAGFNEGEQKSKATIAALRRATGIMFDEIERKDQTDPRVGVLLSYKTIEQIIKNAKSGTENRPLAHKLEQMRDEAQRQNGRDFRKDLLSLVE